MYYDGCSLITLNDTVVGQGSQFSLSQVQVVTATIHLDTIKSYRIAKSSRCVQSSRSPSFACVRVPKTLTSRSWNAYSKITQPITIKYHSEQEEIRLGPACWLWDYVRRSKSGGFFLPLSGGIDSCSTALIVFSMCQLVCESVKKGGILLARFKKNSLYKMQM